MNNLVPRSQAGQGHRQVLLPRVHFGASGGTGRPMQLRHPVPAHGHRAGRGEAFALDLPVYAQNLRRAAPL